MAMRLAQWLAHGSLSFVAVSSIAGVANIFFLVPSWCGQALLFMPGHAVVAGVHILPRGPIIHLDASRESNKPNPPWFNSQV